MKKIFSIIMFFTILLIIIFSKNIFAASLDSLNIETNKTTVRPGENVTIRIDFGANLGAYTINVFYDNNIFEYVSVDGGTINDLSDRIKVSYYSATGGVETRNYMSITFKAKEEITTSNPTEFSVTTEALSNFDGSVIYDNITIPIVKNVTVEPQYVDYSINLEHTGTIVKDEEKEMTLSYSSPMGKYYERARLVAEATTPEGGSVKLMATDEENLEHDIIQSGWGDAQGYKIGGKDVSQVLQVRGIFSQIGNYTITLKLIDRDNSDETIAEKTFSFQVAETAIEEKPEQEVEEDTKPEGNTTTQTPTELPKTGNNIYVPAVAILVLLVALYAIYKLKTNKQ